MHLPFFFCSMCSRSGLWAIVDGNCSIILFSRYALFRVLFGTYLVFVCKVLKYEFGHETDHHGRYRHKHLEIGWVRDANPKEVSRTRIRPQICKKQFERYCFSPEQSWVIVCWIPFLMYPTVSKPFPHMSSSLQSIKCIYFTHSAHAPGAFPCLIRWGNWCCPFPVVFGPTFQFFTIYNI